MKPVKATRNYYVLPCCILLLNLCVEIVSYKTHGLGNPLLRTGAIMGVVLFGGSLVGFVIAPALGGLVNALHRTSQRSAGRLGEIFFLLGLGVVVFWLYYQVYVVGPESVLPDSLTNHSLSLGTK